MKRALGLFAAALALAFILFAFVLPETEEPTTPPVSSGATSPEASGVLGHPTPPATVRPAKVMRLADGDSFDIEWLDTGEDDEIRLFGINAPEGTACFGGAARDVLNELTDDQELLVESIDRDEFGRVLANVWVGELFVNLQLVESGAALVLSDGGTHADLIKQAQERAGESEAGLWNPSSCGADPNASLRIDAIEADAPGQDNLNPNGEWITIVNDGAAPVALTDWSIRDESTRHRYFFPDDFTLAAGAEVRVYSGCGNDSTDTADGTGGELFWCDGDPVWNNRGDTGFLVDPEGRFSDSLSYSG